MGRIGTWLLVAGVAALALLAVLDAVRGGGEAPAAEPERGAETTATETDEVASERWRAFALRELETGGAEGTLLVTDASCEVVRLALPGLEEERPDGRACKFSVTPGGGVGVAPVAVAPNGRVGAECRGDVVGILVPRRDAVTMRGCSPAWRPDGVLTVVRAGALVAVRSCGGRWTCEETLLSPADLHRTFGRDPWAFRTPVVREAAWLGDDRFAAIVRDRETRRDAIAVFAGGELAGGPPFPYERLEDLRPSPRGGFAAARVNRRSLVVVDRDGRYVGSSLRSAHTIAWSADESWTAMAAPGAVYLFRTGERATRLVRLPLDAADVAWQP